LYYKPFDLKKSHIIILFLIAISIGLFASRMGNVDSYACFDDAAKEEGKSLQVIGTFPEDKNIAYDPQADANSFSFNMKDRCGAVHKVVCYDDMPMDFERSDEIVLTGSMKEDIFYAEDMLVKCPSKYQETEVEKN
jgi:cytochrome c-type biogenesis protein CcmE